MLTEADDNAEDDESVGHRDERRDEGVDDELQRLTGKNTGHMDACEKIRPSVTVKQCQVKSIDIHYCG